MKYSKRIMSAIIFLIIVAMFSSFCFPSNTLATDYDYKPKALMYSATSEDVYSTEVIFGHESQEVDCSFSYSVDVPPDTDYGNIIVKGTLQRKTPKGVWVNVRTLESEAQLSNTSKKSHKYVQAYTVGYCDLKNGSEYRVRFTVKNYTGTQVINIAPVYKIDYICSFGE